MAKWSVLLFGHDKPRQSGWERRAVPGDVIAYKPLELEHTWTDTERSHFLVITIAGLTVNQMQAVCEERWDLTTYRQYAPIGDLVTFVSMMRDRILAKRTATDLTILQRMLDDLEERKILLYADYLSNMRERCRYPATHLNKRRFQVPLATLQLMGVDLDKMKDKNLLYNPTLPEIDVRDCYDKLNERNARLLDGFNLIQPRTDLEIEALRIS